MCGAFNRVFQRGIREYFAYVFTLPFWGLSEESGTVILPRTAINYADGGIHTPDHGSTLEENGAFFDRSPKVMHLCRFPAWFPVQNPL